MSLESENFGHLYPEIYRLQSRVASPFASTAGTTHKYLMAMPTLSSRSAVPYLCALFAAFTLIFSASVYYMDWIPGQARFTVNEIYTDDRQALYHSNQEPLGSAVPTGGLGKSGDFTQSSADNCESSLVHLNGLGLSKNIKYTRRCIKPIFLDDADRDVVRNISSPLIANFTTVNLTDQCSTDFEKLQCEPLELPVPTPDPESLGQYAHLLFGVATSSKRLRDSKESFAHWLANSGATLVCMITDGPIELLSLDFAELEAEFAASRVKLKLVGRQDLQHTPEQSHMMLIKDLLSHAAAATLSAHHPHWLGILDDDTFFPSLHALSTELARHDHTRSQYLGALTESSDALRQGVLAAWGGAGIFLSFQLAQEIEPHLDGCLSGRGGDMLIMECIHAHSHARLTTVKGLWQMDFMGDTAGIYESGRRMLSMHHWKSWHWLPVEKMATVTHICGECFLERFVFDAASEHPTTSSRETGSPDRGKGVTVLNVGYSINMYSERLPDLSRVEQTWDGIHAWKDYEWSVGPLRPRLDKDQKKTWWLKTAFHDGKGGLRQIYLHQGGQEGKDDEVIELIWAS